MTHSLLSPLPEILFDPPALFLTKSKTLIFADLHIGAENAFHNKGFFIPKTQTKTIITRCEELIHKHEAEQVVLAGDIKHAIGSILDDEWKDIRELIHILQQHKTKIIIIQGNHDNILSPILKTEGLDMQKSIVIDNYLIIHGDAKETKEQLQDVQGIIIGHEHPSLELDDGVRKERYKCLLKGRYKDKDILIMPSTYPLVEGTDILSNEGLGPIRKQTTDIEAYLVEENKAYYFGKADTLRTYRQKV